VGRAPALPGFREPNLTGLAYAEVEFGVTMNPRTWQDDNARYLSASLKWLRLRLEQFAQAAGPAVPPPALAAVRRESGGPLRRRRLSGIRSNRRAASAAAPLLLPAATMTLAEEVQQAAQARVEAARLDPPPALMLLAQQLGLSAFEQDVLLLCAAMELDTRIGALCARAQNDANRAFPTFALALAMFDDANWDALSPNRPLRYWRLIEINQPGATPLTLSALHADERIVSYLKGLNALDDRVSLIVMPLIMDAGDGHALAPSQQSVADRIFARWRHARPGVLLPTAQLLGSDMRSKELIAAQVSAGLGRRAYRVDVQALPAQAGELEAFARLWQRESMLLPLALYVDAHSSDPHSLNHNAALNRLFSRDLGVAFLAVREAPARIVSPSFLMDTARPTSAEQRASWMEAVHAIAPGTDGAGAEQVARTLASQFDLNLSDIHEVAASADAGPDAALEAAWWDACRARTRPQLDTLAQRIDARATWHDLVLPEEPIRLLRQIAGQVRERSRVYEDWGFAQKMNRGLGISALFAGGSGTGKTMAAEVIANDLRLNLYRIDLSAVVSKYIGETEKNLRQVFDAAEGGGAILFFDEADALFGKRSEVKDSHDRYANIEINYLLQRMESYRGLAILATNMKGALDTAFLRRLRFIVNVPFPGLAERARMWKQVFPQQTPVDGLDYERLARLNLSGGNIHSIALNAAFLAAGKQPPRVTMPLVVEAARGELRKLGLPISGAELR